MITKETIMEAYLFLRKENQSVPSETLEFMKDTALEELQKCEAKNLPIFSVVGSTCLSLKCSRTMNDKWCGYVEKCKYQRYNKEDGLFECQLCD